MHKHCILSYAAFIVIRIDRSRRYVRNGLRTIRLSVWTIRRHDIMFQRRAYFIGRAAALDSGTRSCDLFWLPLTSRYCEWHYQLQRSCVCSRTFQSGVTISVATTTRKTVCPVLVTSLLHGEENRFTNYNFITKKLVKTLKNKFSLQGCGVYWDYL